MGLTAVDTRNAESGEPLRRAPILRTIRGRLRLLSKGLEALRDWRIYADFLSPAYQRNNLARLQHLESLGLDLARKNVLEVGAGIGDHTLFYLYRNCHVVAVEGRPKLARKLSERLGVEVKVIDIDKECGSLEQLGRFDLIHCYGLLYHLSDPGQFLSSVSRIADQLLLETCVSPGDGHSANKTREDAYLLSQALHGVGCRPTRDWVFEALKLRYEYVYATRTQARHPEFPLDWTSPDPSSPEVKRAVFVASHSPITNPNLIPELPQTQDRW